jgi:hypothetical protein
VFVSLTDNMSPRNWLVACGRIVRGMLGDCPINFLMGDQMHKQRAQPTPLDDKNCVHREQCPQDKLVFPHIALSSKNFRLAILTSLVRQYTVTHNLNHHAHASCLYLHSPRPPRILYFRIPSGTQAWHECCPRPGGAEPGPGGGVLYHSGEGA